MGTVYRAEDTMLRRPVALKVLTGEILDEGRTRARLLREARAVAALTHPSICTIYEAGELTAGLLFPMDEGTGDAHTYPSCDAPYLAMELVEGRTLDALIREKGAFPLADLLDIAIQVADGLAAAHQRGIAHRDLKPTNVMVTNEGRAKILDFGLARPLERLRADEGVAAMLETVSRELVRDGRVTGTVAYISPERALGDPGQSQSDVFSFGIMLYEMISGERPFQGETATAVLAKILEAEPPPLARLRPDLPPALLRIIARCLRKKPEERYNDTRDLVAALRECREELARGNARGNDAMSGMPAGLEPITTRVPAPAPRADAGSPRRRRYRRWRWLAAPLALAGAIALLPTMSPRTPAPSPLRTYRITQTSDVRIPAISPDGNFIAYARTRPGLADYVVVHDLRTGTTLDVFRGGLVKDVMWSPDGSELAIGDGSRMDGKAQLVVVSLLGGTGKVVGGLAGGVCWSPDGKYLAGRSGTGEIVIIDRSTGIRSTILPPHKHAWIEGVSWSPRGLLFLVHVRNEESTNEAWIMTVDGRRDFQLKELGGFRGAPQWAPDGRAVYTVGHFSNTSLIKLAVDPETGEPRGRPVSLAADWQADWISISNDGKKLAYARRTMATAELVRVDVGPDDRAGPLDRRALIANVDVRPFSRLSPDGKSVLFGQRNGTGEPAIFTLAISDLNGDSQRSIVSSTGGGVQGAWSPDGKEVACLVYQDSTHSLLLVNLESGETRLLRKPVSMGILEWAPGREILLQRSDCRNYLLLDPQTGKERPLLATEGTPVWQARTSPDGREIAFARSGGPDEAMTVRIASLDGGPEQLLYEGRAAPLGWSQDQGRVFLVRESPEEFEQGKRLDEVVACSVKGGAITRLAAIPDPTGWGQIDVTPDGRHIVYARDRSLMDAWMMENFDPDVR